MRYAIVCIATDAFAPWVHAQRLSLKRARSTVDYLHFGLEHLRKMEGYVEGMPTLSQEIYANRPTAVLHALGPLGYDVVLFVGADVWFTERPDYDFGRVSGGLLTPHFLTPLPDDERSPSNFGTLTTGVYNSDYTFWRNSIYTVNFLKWQREQMRIYSCSKEPPYFYDQGLLSFAPLMSEFIEVNRDPGMNVAYFNLHERKLSKEHGRWMVNGFSLVSFQFSGYDPINKPMTLSRFNTRKELQTLAVTQLMMEFLNDFSDYRA